MARPKGSTNRGYALEERPRVSGKPWWRVVIVIDGRRQVVGTFRTRGEAQRAGAEAVVQRERGTLLKPNETTVGELLDLWLAQEMPKTVAEPQHQNYEIVVRKHIKPALGGVLVQKLTVQAVETLYAQLRDGGASASLQRKCHLRLSSALNMAVRWGWIHKNPCDGLRTDKIEGKEPAIWTPIETASFLAVAKRDNLHPYWQLAVETGGRTSELLGLTWSEINLDRGTLTIGRHAVRLIKGTPTLKSGGKTQAAPRTVRLTKELLDELKSHQDRQQFKRRSAVDWINYDLIFPTASGRPVNPSHVRRSFDRLVKQAGVNRLTPHGMRKSHITSLIAAGANPKSVAARVGHRDVTTTLKTYTALTTAMQDELHNIVETLTAAHREQETG